MILTKKIAMIFIIQIKSLEIALSGNGNLGKCPFGKVKIRVNVPLEKWKFGTMSLRESGDSE